MGVQFFDSNGETVELGSIGLGKDFENASSVVNKVDKFSRSVNWF